MERIYERDNSDFRLMRRQTGQFRLGSTIFLEKELITLASGFTKKEIKQKFSAYSQLMYFK